MKPAACTFGNMLVALLLAACAGEAPDSAVTEPETLTAQVHEASAHDVPEVSEPCGAVFTPEPALLAETTAAAARWSAATGCDVRVGDGGIPVRLVDMLYDDAGHAQPEMFGLQHWTESGEIVIDVTALRSQPVIPHEMGHALFPRHGHVDDDVSLMSSHGGAWRITAADLAFVCEGFPCALFTPES